MFGTCMKAEAIYCMSTKNNYSTSETIMVSEKECSEGYLLSEAYLLLFFKYGKAPVITKCL